MGAHEALGKSDEWYTPKYIFDALGCGFDVDVAASNSEFECVPAPGRIYRNSLQEDWHNYIWMNPPFGGRNGLQPWLEKFFKHGNGIALTPDRTSAPWFRYAWERADLVMFLPKVKFIRPNGTTGDQPGCGTALWASGDDGCWSLENAQRVGLGILAKPLR